MPLQNRVTPFGEIIADPARGTFFGNRGGRIHNPATKTLTKRRWASRQWIICVLEFKNRQRQVMGNSYTELFFLDEVTALAAGHRPCFECRRAAAKAFFAANHAFNAMYPESMYADRPMRAPDMDMILHIERTSTDEKIPLVPSECPDGTVFELDGAAWAVRDGQLLHWTPAGYDRAIPVKGIGSHRVLTPMTTMCILQHGYEPTWHESADTI